MSADEVNELSDRKNDFNLVVASLRGDKKRQTIRIVNPTDDKIEYVFKMSPNLLNSSLSVEPSSGYIEPRDFSHIAIENKNFEAEVSQIKRLHLIYRKFDSTRQRGYVKGLVPIDMINYHTKLPLTRTEEFTWIIIRSLRSIFLAALIIYNIILIKLKFE